MCVHNSVLLGHYQTRSLPSTPHTLQTNVSIELHTPHSVAGMHSAKDAPNHHWFVTMFVHLFVAVFVCLHSARDN